MDLRRSCATVYVPARGGGTRRLSLPAWAALAAVVGVPVAAAAAVMLALGAGPDWLAAGSPLARENALLRATMAGLDQDVADLSGELADLDETRNRLAFALDVDGTRQGAAVTGGSGARQALIRARESRQAWAALADSVAARAAARTLVPSRSPCDAGWASSVYGPRLDPFTGRRVFHRGIDISVPSGTAVRATADGAVATVERQVGLGLVVKVDHGPGLQTVYAHLERALVRPGQAVAQGQVIARSGSSGRSTAPHLHYEVRRDGRAVNPRPYLGEPAAPPGSQQLAAR